MARLVLPFLTLVFGAWLFGCSSGVTTSVSGTVLSLSGPVSLSLLGSKASTTLAVGDPAPPGSRLSTGTDGKAVVALLPSVLVQLQPSSALEVRELSLTKDGNETGDAMRGRIARIQLISGTITVSQERSDVGAEPRLTVELPKAAVVSTYDCLFSVSVEPSGTRVTCASGYVYVQRPGAAENRLQPGFTFEILSDHSTRTSAAESTSTGQSAIADALESETAMRALRDQRRDVLPR